MDVFTNEHLLATTQDQESGRGTPEKRSPRVGSFPRASVSVVHVHNGQMSVRSCNAICEREFRVFANGKPMVTLLCSDVALKELAYGFLYSEQVIQSLEEVRKFSLDEREMAASFELSVPVQKPECPTVSSGFGGKVLCSNGPRGGEQADWFGKEGFVRNAFAGSSLLQGAFTGIQAQKGSLTLSEVIAAMETMRECAQEYTITRGMHCSALFKEGKLISSFEDIGRHNTFDKLAGCCLLEKRSSAGALLTTTGRVSGEMMRKALRFGVAGVASFSGPTDVAIDLAQDAGALLVGYVGKDSATVYSGVVD